MTMSHEVYLKHKVYKTNSWCQLSIKTLLKNSANIAFKYPNINTERWNGDKLHSEWE